MIGHDARTCVRCVEDRPCAAANRERAWWAEDEAVMETADGLDAIAARVRKRHASDPRRLAPVARDRFDTAYEIDPAEEKS